MWVTKNYIFTKKINIFPIYYGDIKEPTKDCWKPEWPVKSHIQSTNYSSLCTSLLLRWCLHLSKKICLNPYIGGETTRKTSRVIPKITFSNSMPKSVFRRSVHVTFNSTNTQWMLRDLRFQTKHLCIEFELSPPVNPPTIVLITPWSRVSSREFSSRPYVFSPRESYWIHCFYLAPFHGSLSRDGSLRNFYRCFFWINFIILSLKEMQSLVLWPTTRWYWQYLDLLAPGGGRFLVDN